ncbi:MAG TPA: hypothetical protein DIT87_04355 [Clostridiales bacterium]|nr:hypothetical protein [Clostridiales bacterium]
MKTQSFTCPNCNAPLESISGKPMMFCPYCGSKIANNDIAFYAEDSKTARIETVTDAVIKILGTKEQREEAMQRYYEEARKNRPYMLIVLLVCGVILVLVFLFFVLLALDV